MFIAKNKKEFDEFSQQKKCVAFGESGIMYMGEPEPIPGHYYLHVSKQDLTNNQISHLRKILEPEFSDEEIMLKYDNSEQFFDVGSNEDARRVWKKLKELFIESHIKNKKITHKDNRC